MSPEQLYVEYGNPVDVEYVDDVDEIGMTSEERLRVLEAVISG